MKTAFIAAMLFASSLVVLPQTASAGYRTCTTSCYGNTCTTNCY